MTIVPFTQNTFLGVLRRQLSQLFRLSLLTLEERHRRSAMTSILRNPESASPHDLELMRIIALDELEEKRLRKETILGLVSRDGVDDETLLELAGSLEQGFRGWPSRSSRGWSRHVRSHCPCSRN